MPPLGLSETMPGMMVGSPHWPSQPVIWAISGACAVRIRVASCLTVGLPARAAASSAITIACSWCGIIVWVNMTSAALWLAAGLLAAALLMVDVLLVLDVLLPQAATVAAAASSAASRTPMRFTVRPLVQGGWSPGCHGVHPAGTSRRRSHRRLGAPHPAYRDRFRPVPRLDVPDSFLVRSGSGTRAGSDPRPGCVPVTPSDACRPG